MKPIYYHSLASASARPWRPHRCKRLYSGDVTSSRGACPATRTRSAPAPLRWVRLVHLPGGDKLDGSSTTRLHPRHKFWTNKRALRPGAPRRPSPAVFNRVKYIKQIALHSATDGRTDGGTRVWINGLQGVDRWGRIPDCVTAWSTLGGLVV